MPTRADFYVGQGPTAEWIGSIAYDGVPESLPRSIIEATMEHAYRWHVEQELLSRDDATLPKDGWPWPWDNSAITDFCYAFIDDRVAVFGPGDKRKREFPNAEKIKNVARGRRSGII